MPLESYSCACTVKDGKLKLFNREAFEKALYQFPDGLDLELVIQELKAHHTRAQEKYFHGPVLRCFIENCGYRKEEAKAMLCLMFIPREIRQLDGAIVVVPGSTAALDKREYTDLIESCIQLAAEQGWYIKDSEEWRRDNKSAA